MPEAEYIPTPFIWYSPITVSTGRSLSLKAIRVALNALSVLFSISSSARLIKENERTAISTITAIKQSVIKIPIRRLKRLLLRSKKSRMCIFLFFLSFCMSYS